MNVKPFYLNITLLNKSGVIKEKVGDKVGRGIFGRAMASVASSVVSDASVIKKIAEELVAQICEVTTSMGISCSLQRRFQSGPFVTLKVKVTEIEKSQLILAAKGEEYANSFHSLVENLTALGLAETALPKIDEKIENLVYINIMAKFAEKIPAALSEKGVECCVDVISAEEQAEFFFDVIEGLSLN